MIIDRVRSSLIIEIVKINMNLLRATSNKGCPNNKSKKNQESKAAFTPSQKEIGFLVIFRRVLARNWQVGT